MKKSMIWRSTFREIKSSFGRFAAILAIVALGVGLFSGLKITKADFLKTTTNYFEETDFYDYRVLGELGFSQEQVDYFASLEGVKYAEGALYQDVLVEDEGGVQKVARIHSITDGINRITLVSGRLPERENECVADSKFFGKGIVGKKIVLSQSNSDEKLEAFQEKELTVVGLVQSPLYIQFERGNTSIGTGKIDCFIYLPKAGFTQEDYTEVYIKFQKNFDLYSDAYQSFLDTQNDQWENYVDRACELRFEEMPELLAKAEKTLDEERQKAEKELEDARIQLEDARVELADAKQKLEDAEIELADGEAELARALTDLEEGENTLEEKKAELEDAKKKIEDGSREIEENQKLLAEKEAEITAAKTALQAASLQVELGGMQIQMTAQELISRQQSLDATAKELDEKEEEINRLENYYSSIGQGETHAQEIADQRAQVSLGRLKHSQDTAKLSKDYLDYVKLQGDLAQGKADYEDGIKQIADGEAVIAEGKEQLLTARLELLDAKQKVSQGEYELRKGQMDITQAHKDLREGEITLENSRKEIEDGWISYEEGLQEYEDGLKEYEDGLKEYEETIAKAEKDIQKLRDKIAEGDLPEGYLLGRNTNIGYVCFENDSAIVDGIANVFPVFFFLVAALVCITTMNRMVEEQRTQIGVLKALGYSDGRIMFKFLFYSGLAAVSGCILGYLGGIHLFPYIIWTVYGIMYQVSGIVFTFNPWLALLSLTVSLLCSVGTTWLSCGRELAGQAATLMRPKAPKAGKRVFLEYVPFLWKKLSFLSKVAVRNILRYKKRLFMMVLGIGGCTGLLITGFGIKDSIANIGDMQYTEVMNYDISVMLQNPLDEKMEIELTGLQGLDSYLSLQETSLDLVNSDLQKAVTVVTLPENITDGELKDYINLHTKNGTHIAPPGYGEAVITDKIAADFHVSVGDMITLRDEEMHEVECTVSGIAKNFIYNYVYLESGTWQEKRGVKSQPKTLYLKAKQGADIRALSVAVMEMDGIANVSVNEDMLNRFNTMMSSLNLIVVVVTFCAAGLAFVVLYNLTNINITERIREIATIKVLGFYQSETALYVFRENLVLTFLGAIAGIFMGKWLHSFVMNEINVDMVSFDVRILPQSYVYSILLTFLFALAVNLMMNPRLDKVSMTESLKSVD